MARLVFKAALIVALGPLGTGRGEEAASTAPGTGNPLRVGQFGWPGGNPPH